MCRIARETLDDALADPPIPCLCVSPTNSGTGCAWQRLRGAPAGNKHCDGAAPSESLEVVEPSLSLAITQPSASSSEAEMAENLSQRRLAEQGLTLLLLVEKRERAGSSRHVEQQRPACTTGPQERAVEARLSLAALHGRRISSHHFIEGRAVAARRQSDLDQEVARRVLGFLLGSLGPSSP